MQPDFEKAQNMATKLLLQQDINSLYIDIRNFCFDRKIIIDTLQNYCRITKRKISDFICNEHNDCCVLKLKGNIFLILYNDNELNEARKHWGIVHEVGHIYLDHKFDNEIEEKEAHFFSAQIVAPEIALLDIWLKNGEIQVKDLTDNFHISKGSAQKRIETFNKRLVVHDFNSVDNSKLLHKLRPFLDDLFPDTWISIES